MHMFIWGTLTSVGRGRYEWFTETVKAKLVGPAMMQGMWGEIYDVPDEGMTILDDFERHYGYIRVTCDVEKEVDMYIPSPRGDVYYSGDQVKDKYTGTGKTGEIPILGPNSLRKEDPEEEEVEEEMET